MATYSVLLEEINSPNPQWARLSLKVKAPTGKYAMTKAVRIMNDKHRVLRYKAVSARISRHDPDYWHKIWRKAFDNMPSRLMTIVDKSWEDVPKNSVTIPDFISESANGRMRQLNTGEVQKLIVKKHHYKMGGLAALTKLLGYARNSDKGGRSRSMGHLTVMSNMTHGYRPRDEKRRELLLKLADKDGTGLALKLLGKRFEPVKLRKVKP